MKNLIRFPRNFCIALAAIFAFLNLNFVGASGVVHLAIGEKMELKIDENNISKAEWILKFNGEVLGKKSGLQIEHIFKNPGEFELNSIAQKRDGTTKNTNFKIFVVGSEIEKIEQIGSVKAILQTLPQKNENDVVEISAGEKVYFFGQNSVGEIDSFLIGEKDDENLKRFSTKNFAEFKNGENIFEKNFSKNSEICLTVASGEEKVDVDCVEIKIKNEIENSAAKNLSAILNTFPPADESGIVHLSNDQNSVAFFAANSGGEILQFQIDADINFDSDGNGNPADDVDNANHESLKTGENFPFSYQKNSDEIVAQLIVVDKNGEGSLIQRKIIFEKEKITESQKNEVLKTIEKRVGDAPNANLISDKNQIFQNEVVKFTVLNAPENAKISWDFNNDGKNEIENGTAQAAFRFQKKGDFEVAAKFTENGVETKLSREIEVQKNKNGEIQTAPPVADFSFLIDENFVKFENFSLADSNLANEKLTCFWEFGDGKTAEECDAEHLFKILGEFETTLTVTDSADRKAKISKKIKIEKLATAAITAEKKAQIATIAREKAKTQAKEFFENTEGVQIFAGVISAAQKLWESKFSKYGAFGFLGVFGILALYVFYQKVRYPSLSLGEILAGLKGAQFEEQISNFAEKIDAAAGISNDEENSQNENQIPVLQSSPEFQNDSQNTENENFNESSNVPENSAIEVENKEIEESTENETAPTQSPILQSSTDAPTEIAEPKSEIDTSDPFGTRGEMPDWLKVDDSQNTENSNEISNTSETATTENTAEEISSENLENETEKSSDEDFKSEVEKTPPPENFTDEDLSNENAAPEFEKNETENEEIENEKSDADDEIPEWLKVDDSQNTENSNEISNAPETAENKTEKLPQIPDQVRDDKSENSPPKNPDDEMPDWLKVE